MKKIYYLVVAVIVLVVIFVAAGNKSEEKMIKIGVVAPLTGGAAGYGEPFVKSIGLAEADFDSANNKYQFIFEDDESNPAKSASAAQKLINIDKVDAIITTTSGTGNAVKPIATANKTPHICVCVDIGVADNITNFIYTPLPKMEAEAWVAEALNRGVKKVAIVAQNQAGMNLIVGHIKEGLQARGIAVVSEDRFEPGTKDFKTLLAKAKATEPDVYLIAAFPPAIDIIGQEARNLGIHNMSGVGTIAIANPLANYNGSWFTDVRLVDQNFKNRFELAFPDIRFSVRTAPYGYDVANILMKAFESGDDVATHIINLKSYDGKVGNITKGVNAGSFSAPLGIWEIQDGEVVMVK